MMAVALGWCTMQFVSTPICYVNRPLLATAVSKFLVVMNNPG